ncbi:uncharacterized protein LOC122395101 [Colletes gigas]|uniref:uncharacterized protein LOC122395101 n=1 Tax=Colletes gigas TaxID=935657 RepID=UPI001C9ADA58|nr:uncharacterized protein LOC122395101 [Colletes gigas]
MGCDGELTGILRDVVQFLECLREVKLPVSLESIRDSLLIRSKDTLTMFMVKRIERSTSPEAYLNMNAAGSKGLVIASKTEAEGQEYVEAEEHPPQKQSQCEYYESFDTVEPTNNVDGDDLKSKDKETAESTLMDAYANFSTAQTKSKCLKYGPLYRKEGKKLFVFEQYREYWVGLVGLHLLIYGSDHDNRPCMILPIRGYTARAAPNAIPRDQRRSESTFEIICPGSKTFQFVARTPKDMEQWVAQISELGSEERHETKEHTKLLTTSPSEKNDTSQSDEKLLQKDSSFKEERYQDVESLGIDKPMPDESSIVPSIAIDKETVNPSPSSKDTLSETTKSPIPIVPASIPAPPLPARIPRRLPSLPVHGSSSSYELSDEEEDIYHKIDDFKDITHCYENANKVCKARVGDKQSKKSTSYDDVCANVKEKNKSGKKSKKNRESPAKQSIASQNEETYDDAASAITVSKDRLEKKEKFQSYDDVESTLSNDTSGKARTPEKTEEPTKSPQKKSFLDRVRSRKESPRKSEKKQKRRTPTPPPTNVQELPTYDDVSNLINGQEAKQNVEEEESEYKCPPPPRPVYAQPPVIADAVDEQELYDDVAECRKAYKTEDTCQSDRRASRQLNYVHGSTCTEINDSVSSDNIEDNDEHYQIPRSSESNKYPPVDQQEELYDDIAILADFTARQKELLCKKDSEDVTKTQSSFEKRSWNRFVNGKKYKITESVTSERNSRISSGAEDADDLAEQHGLTRINTFQKLINKMENSLGKASVKTTSSMLLNKTNVANNT